MPEYRRWLEPGATFFFTVVTERRAPILCNDRARKLLRAAVLETRTLWPFDVFAWVLQPDHLHTIWKLPPGDTAFPRRWGFLKKQFTRGWLAAGGSEQVRSTSRERNRRRGVWQRRFWEHKVRDEQDLQRLTDYIHYNPVKHGLATCAHAWPYSTFGRFVERGFYPADWYCACRSGGQAVDPARIRRIDAAADLAGE